MKKILSTILACAMIMSLFCVVPVSAETSYGTYAFPYIYENFEENTTLFGESAGKYTPTIVDSGSINHGKVAQITVQGTTNAGATMKNADGALSTILEVGDKITVSMWIKTNVKLKTANFSIICFPDRVNNFTGTLNGNGYHSFVVPFNKDSTDWQYVTQTFESTFGGNTKALEYRFGTTGGLNYAQGESSTGAVDRIYSIDNFEILIEKKGGVKGKVYPYEEVVSLADNESWSGLSFDTKPAADTMSVVTGTTADPAPAGDKFLRYTHDNAGKIWMRIPLKENLKAGHTYKLSFKVRLQGLPLQNGTLDPAGPTNPANRYDYINFQIRYPIVNKTATWGANSSAIGGYYSDSKPYTDARYNSGGQTNRLGMKNWKEMSVIISSDKLNIEENLSSNPWIEMGFWLYNSDGQGLGTYDFDDIKVIDYGPMTAGGFDTSWSSANIQNGSRTNSDKRIGLMSGWIMDSGVAKWSEKTATSSSAFTTVQGGACIPTEQQSDKFGLLYGQLKDTAEFYQYVPTYAGVKYEIKGYVRGAIVDDQATKGRARLVVDYSGETLAEEIYDVKSLGENGIIYGDWVEFDGAYNLDAPLKVSVDLTDIPFYEGKSETAGIMPRTPKVYVDFDEEWESNVNAPNTASHGVYMDAFTIERLQTGVVPGVGDVYAFGEPKAGMKIDYRYVPNQDLIDFGDASIIKLCTEYGSNTLVLATCKAGEELFVPSNVREDDELFIEIIPFTTSMVKGTPIISNILPKFDIDFQIDPFSEGNATAKAIITSNDPESVQTNAVLVLCTYDADGALIKFEHKPMICLPGESTDGDTTTPDVDYTYVTATAVPGTAAAKAKAFLWDCGTETLPTVFNTTMSELSATLEVTN